MTSAPVPCTEAFAAIVREWKCIGPLMQSIYPKKAKSSERVSSGTCSAG
jgi:hypothetical protein